MNLLGFASIDWNTLWRDATIRGAVRKPSGKVKALRREGPKRGARELFSIIGTRPPLVNTSVITNGVAQTVLKTASGHAKFSGVTRPG